MILTAEELKYTTDRMNIYDIKYREIFNELLDHVISGIEERRKQGDTREIAAVFQNVIDDHFGGYVGIEEVAKSHEKAYKNKVSNMMRANMKYYINWQSFTYVLAAILLGYLLPGNKVIMKLLIAGIAVLAFAPVIYAYIGLRKVTGGKGKYSLMHAYITTQAALPISLFNCLIFLPRVFTDDDNFNFLMQSPPALLVAIIAILYIYTLSCIRLCKQELKSIVNI